MTNPTADTPSACAFLLSTRGCRTHDEFIRRVSQSLPMEAQVSTSLDALYDYLDMGLYFAGTDDVTIYWVDGKEASQTLEGARLLDVLESCGPHLALDRDVKVHVVLGAPAWAS